MQHGKMYTIVSKISNAFLEVLVQTTKHPPDNWLPEKRRSYREICKQRTRQVVGWEAAGGFVTETDYLVGNGNSPFKFYVLIEDLICHFMRKLSSWIESLTLAMVFTIQSFVDIAQPH